MRAVLTWTQLVLTLTLLLPPAAAQGAVEALPSGCGAGACCCDDGEPAGPVLEAPDGGCPCSVPAPRPTRAHGELLRPACERELELEPAVSASETTAPPTPAPAARARSVRDGPRRPPGPSRRALVCSWTL